MRHVKTDVKVSIDPQTKSEVVSFSEDLNAVRERTLSSNMLLECSGGCTATVDFSIIKTGDQQILREIIHVRLENLRIVSSSKRPSDVTCAVTYIRSDRVVA